VAARHELDLPGGKTLRALYLPAALERGDRVHINGESYQVAQVLTIVDELHGAVVRARLTHRGTRRAVRDRGGGGADIRTLVAETGS
jgi:hypothetical protein